MRYSDEKLAETMRALYDLQKRKVPTYVLSTDDAWDLMIEVFMHRALAAMNPGWEALGAQILHGLLGKLADDAKQARIQAKKGDNPCVS